MIYCVTGFLIVKVPIIYNSILYRPQSPSHPEFYPLVLRDHLVHPLLLQLLDLDLELLNLLVAVQRPAVVVGQALDDLVPCALDTLGQSPDLLPLLELATELLDLLADRVAALALLRLVLVGGGGDLVLGRLEGLGLLVLELLQLLGHASLDLDLNRSGT